MRRIISAIFLGLAAFFAWAFYDRYWRFRDCFDENGRCYDAETGQVLLISGGFWSIFSAICALFAIWLLRKRSGKY